MRASQFGWSRVPCIRARHLQSKSFTVQAYDKLQRNISKAGVQHLYEKAKDPAQGLLTTVTDHALDIIGGVVTLRYYLTVCWDAFSAGFSERLSGEPDFDPNFFGRLLWSASSSSSTFPLPFPRFFRACPAHLRACHQLTANGFSTSPLHLKRDRWCEQR